MTLNTPVKDKQARSNKHGKEVRSCEEKSDKERNRFFRDILWRGNSDFLRYLTRDNSVLLGYLRKFLPLKQKWINLYVMMKMTLVTQGKTTNFGYILNRQVMKMPTFIHVTTIWRNKNFHSFMFSLELCKTLNESAHLLVFNMLSSDKKCGAREQWPMQPFCILHVYHNLSLLLRKSQCMCFKETRVLSFLLSCLVHGADSFLRS